jgi:hypothetical protein
MGLQMRQVDPIGRQGPPLHFAESIVADTSGEVRLGAEPGCCHGLICAFATGYGAKGRPDEGLARFRAPWHTRDQVYVGAADDENLGRIHPVTPSYPAALLKLPWSNVGTPYHSTESSVNVRFADHFLSQFTRVVG